MTIHRRAETANGSRRRSLAGAIAALLLLPFLLGSESCFWVELKTPIGDPDRALVDPRMSGVWLSANMWLGANVGEPPSNFSGWIWVFEPNDSRTWLVTWVIFEDNGEPVPPATPSGSPTAEQVAPAPPQKPAKPGEPGQALTAIEVIRIVETLAEERAKPAGVAVFKAWLTTLAGRTFLVLEPRVMPSTERGFRPSSWLVYGADLQEDRLLLSVIDIRAEGLKDATTRAKAEDIIARHAADPKFSEVLFILSPVPRVAYDQAGKALKRAVGIN